MYQWIVPDILVLLGLLCWFTSRIRKGKGGYLFYYLLFLAGVVLLWGLSVNLTDAIFMKIMQRGTAALVGIQDPYGDAQKMALMIRWLLEAVWTWVLGGIFLKERVKKVYKTQYLLFLTIPVCSVVFMVSFLTVSDYYTGWNGYGLVILNALLLLFMNVFVVGVYNQTAKSYEAEKKYRLHEQEKQLLYEHYLKLEESYQQSRKIVHDVKNHMQALIRLYGEGEIQKAQEYSEEVFHLLNQTSHIWYTEHKMLNIILNEKLTRELLERTKLELDIEADGLDCIREIDITTIFANLLDNAIEALEGCAAPFLKIKAEKSKEFLVIEIVNTVGKSKEKNKRNGHQGLGLENVKEALKKYEGTCTIEQEEGEFRVILLIPDAREEEKA